MPEKSFTLYADHRRVSKILSKSETRTLLECVHLRPGIIEATNGFTAIQKKCDYDGRPLLFNFEELNQCKDWKIDKVVQPVEFTRDPDTNKYDAEGKFTNVLSPVQGTYPEIDSLHPSNAPVFQIQLSKTRLKSLLDAFDADDERLRFIFYGQESQVVISNPSNETKAIIMPLIDHGQKEG